MSRNKSPNKNPKERADRELTRKRVEQVLEIRLDGADWWDVRDFVREEEAKPGSLWYVADGGNPLSDSQVRRYILKADEIIAASAEKDRAKLIGRHLAQRRRLYARAVQAGDLRTALAVLRDEAQLLALYPNPEDEARKAIEAMRSELNELLGIGPTGPAAEPAGPDQGQEVDGEIPE